MFADGYLKLGDFGVSKVLQTLTIKPVTPILTLSMSLDVALTLGLTPKPKP